jgi:hypothetical protein
VTTLHVGSLTLRPAPLRRSLKNLCRAAWIWELLLHTLPLTTRVNREFPRLLFQQQAMSHPRRTFPHYALLHTSRQGL